MDSLLQRLRRSQPSDRALRSQLEHLQAEARQLQATVTELEAAILRSQCEVGELADRALEAMMKRAAGRARTRAVRAKLNLNDWTPVVVLLLLSGALVLVMIALGLAR